MRTRILLAAAAIAVPSFAQQLGAYNVKLDETTVSGISSGGYMAVQFGVAWSSKVRGVGVVAGGPYWCAQDSVSTATGTCQIGSPSVATSTNQTDSYASSGAIDATSNLARQKVWIFSGYNDGVVKRSVVNSLVNYYAHYIPGGQIFFKSNTSAGHGQPTVAYGNSCAYTGPNFMNSCNYDAAGDTLQHLFGKLNPKQTGALSGSVLSFDQSYYISYPNSYSMSYTGYVYVPASCAAGQPCRVHVALHGCRQDADDIGGDYYNHAGYNEWADTNNLIVLYPQTIASNGAPYNPKACWDWWGYNESGYATKSGSQIAAVKAMLNRLAAGYTGWSSAPGGSFGAPQNVAAFDATNGRIDLSWSGVGGATSYNVYRATCSTCAFSKVGSSGTPSYGDSGLSASTTYSYKVRAFNGASESGDSAIVSRATAANPPSCDPYFRDNYTHTTEGRAYALYGYTYADGSNDYMGVWNIYTETNLIQTSSGYYRAATCP